MNAWEAAGGELAHSASPSTDPLMSSETIIAVKWIVIEMSQLANVVEALVH